MGQHPDDEQDGYWKPGRYVGSDEETPTETPSETPTEALPEPPTEALTQHTTPLPQDDWAAPPSTSQTGYGADYPYGGQALGYGQPPAYGQPSAYGQQPPTYGQQPPSYGQQPPAYGQQPPAYGQQPPAYGQVGYGGQPPNYGQPPSYGQPHQWASLPPEELARMHQPGVIPLRPLRLGDMFEGALRTMRRNPEATIGMAVLVLAVLMVPSLAMTMLIPTLFPDLALVDALSIASLIPTLFNSLATLTLSGFVIYVVSEAALGDRVGIGQTWVAVRGRIPALVGISILNFLIVFGLLLGVVLIGVLLAVALGPVGAILMVVGMLALIPFLLWLYARLSLGAASVVLEKAGPATGIKRSWALTTGKEAWRVLGITLLAGILASIFAAIIGGLLAVLIGTIITAVSGDFSTQYYLQVVVDHLSTFLIGAIVTPFTAGVTALLYLDQRMRREGLDVGLVRAAQDRTARRA